MAVITYASTDTDAPQLQGVTGNTGFINVLRACLCDGYGTQVSSGWTLEFSDIGKAVFRTGGGNRTYLRIDETNAQYPILRGYKTMSTIDTGLVAFPSTAQLAGGIRPVKSYTTTAVNRPWIVVATDRAFYFWITYYVTSIGTPDTYTDVTFFGDFVSYLPGDTFNTAIIGKITNDTSPSNTRFGTLVMDGSDITGHYLMSSYLQDANSYPCGVLGSPPANSTNIGNAGAAYPDPITGGLLMDKVRICEGGSANKRVRGHLPGLFNVLHNQPAQHMDILSGRGVLSGTNLLLLYRGGTAGRFALSLNEAHWLPPS